MPEEEEEEWTKEKLKNITYRAAIAAKKVQKYISTHNSAIFWATDSRFCMKVHMVCPTKLQSTKVPKKVKKYKTEKYKNTKTHKMQIYKKCKNVKNLKAHKSAN